MTRSFRSCLLTCCAVAGVAALASLTACGDDDPSRESEDGDGGSGPGGGVGMTAGEIAECQSKLQASLAASEPGEGMFVGAFQENADSEDPTGGLIIAFFPLGDGPILGQMVNTYLDCLGNIGTGGTYKGERVDDTLSGEYTMRQLHGDFGGGWTSTATADNSEIAGTFTVTSGPANGECASGHGATDCYCVSPGGFDLRHSVDGNDASEDNVPFDVSDAGGAGVVLTSLDNPNTADDESGQAQQYALLALDKVCSNDLPIVGFCPNLSDASPLTVQYSASCQISMPPTDADQLKFLTCACVFLEPLAEGAWHVAAGINNEAGSGGISFDNIDVMSFELFQY